MKSIAIFICVLIFFSGDIYAQWIEAGRSTDNSIYYLRKHSEKYGSTKVWVKEVSKSLAYYTKTGKKAFINGYSMTLYDTNCDEKQLALVSLTVYNLSGNVVSTTKLEEYEIDWQDVIPDSVGEMILTKACELL